MNKRDLFAAPDAFARISEVAAMSERRDLGADHRGRQIVCHRDGRDYLGDVVDAYRSIRTGRLYLVVRHFNGELWPFDPCHEEVTDLR